MILMLMKILMTSDRTYKEIKEQIIELCRASRSAKELSFELGINKIYLVNNYLKKMVEEGNLGRTNPAPRARNQKYYTVINNKE